MIETVNQRLTHDSWIIRRWSWWRQISSKPPHQYHSYWSWYLPPVRDGDYSIVPNIISAKNKLRIWLDSAIEWYTDGTRHAYRATFWLRETPHVTCWPVKDMLIVWHATVRNTIRVTWCGAKCTNRVTRWLCETFLLSDPLMVQDSPIRRWRYRTHLSCDV